MNTRAFSEIRKRLHLAIAVMLVGDGPEKADARRQLLTFIDSHTPPEVKAGEPYRDPMDGFVWWPAILPHKSSEPHQGDKPEPIDGWVCFHCGQRFRLYDKAKAHFSSTSSFVPACIKTENKKAE